MTVRVLIVGRYQAKHGGTGDEIDLAHVTDSTFSYVSM